MSDWATPGNPLLGAGMTYQDSTGSYTVQDDGSMAPQTGSGKGGGSASGKGGATGATPDYTGNYYNNLLAMNAGLSGATLPTAIGKMLGPNDIGAEPGFGVEPGGVLFNGDMWNPQPAPQPNVGNLGATNMGWSEYDPSTGTYLTGQGRTAATMPFGRNEAEFLSLIGADPNAPKERGRPSAGMIQPFYDPTAGRWIDPAAERGSGTMMNMMKARRTGNLPMADHPMRRMRQQPVQATNPAPLAADPRLAAMYAETGFGSMDGGLSNHEFTPWDEIRAMLPENEQPMKMGAGFPGGPPIADQPVPPEYRQYQPALDQAVNLPVVDNATLPVDRGPPAGWTPPAPEVGPAGKPVRGDMRVQNQLPPWRRTAQRRRPPWRRRGGNQTLPYGNPTS